MKTVLATLRTVLSSTHKIGLFGFGRKPWVSFKRFSTGTFSAGAVMAIHHASSGELIDIRPLQDNLIITATKTLFKSNHLEVSRKVLLAGEGVPSHQVAGR